MKNILKVSLFIFGLFFSFSCVEAKSISSSYHYADDTVLSYVDDVYQRENYKYGLLVSEYTSISQYNNVTYYYLCLTDDEIDTSNASSVSSSCEKLYRFYRYSSDFNLIELSDKSLTATNSIYYFFDNKNYFISALFVIFVIVFVTWWLFQIIIYFF